nr:hypothetical protein [Pantoea agglomerans]
MNKLVSIISGAAGLIAIISAAIAMIWFFAGLESRIKNLEGQMQAIYQSASMGTQNTKAKENKDEIRSSNVQISNSQMKNLVETCATLAVKAANAYEQGTSLTVAGPLEKMMNNIGCNKIQQ